ncbi:hypothetical protein LEN26_015304 [Aphanomyces euteiches]|nr:hypothetical protein LEN26_015304 [Aphanomyces euteiches]
MLLREVNTRQPFRLRRGLVMDAWLQVAEALSSQEGFSRVGFDDKRAHNRFSLLIENHRSHNLASLRASGVEEDYDEKTQLLDELLASIDDAKGEERERLAESQRETERAEEMGRLIREEAMESLGKRKSPSDQESTGGGGQIMKIMSIIQEDNKAELEFRKFQYERELEERRKEREIEMLERQKDRAMHAEQMKMQHESLLAVVRELSKRG